MKIRKDYFENRRSLAVSAVVIFNDYTGRIKFLSRKTLMIMIFLLSGLKAVAPDSNAFTIYTYPAINPYEKLMYATAMVETMGDIMAYNEFENAAGIFQIRQVRIDEYNRRTGMNYCLADMFNPDISEKIFLYFASLYRPHEFEKISKAWNGSGPKTEFYWKRIKQYL